MRFLSQLFRDGAAFICCFAAQFQSPKHPTYGSQQVRFGNSQKLSNSYQTSPQVFNEKRSVAFEEHRQTSYDSRGVGAAQRRAEMVRKKIAAAAPPRFAELSEGPRRCVHHTTCLFFRDGSGSKRTSRRARTAGLSRSAAAARSVCCSTGPARSATAAGRAAGSAAHSPLLPVYSFRTQKKNTVLPSSFF